MWQQSELMRQHRGRLKDARGAFCSEQQVDASKPECQGSVHISTEAGGIGSKARSESSFIRDSIPFNRTFKTSVVRMAQNSDTVSIVLPALFTYMFLITNGSQIHARHPTFPSDGNLIVSSHARDGYMVYTICDCNLLQCLERYS